MTFSPGDLVTVDFPGVTGIKRRPAVVLSSKIYHSLRPDVIVGLITTQSKVLGITGVADFNYELSSRQFLKPRTELTCG